MNLDIYSTEEMQLVEKILRKVYANMDYNWDKYESRPIIRLDDYEENLLTKIIG